MLKLLLDHDYLHSFPAVDSSPFSNHGLVTDATHSTDGRRSGSGALQFALPSASVRVALRPCWQRLPGLAAEAVIRPQPTRTRRNIVEGDGSFAVFLNPDDTLVGSVFALVDGAAAPGWHTVVSNEPVPMGRWSTIAFHYDGITRGRVFLDGRALGTRGDYRSTLAPVGGAGVVIGNWTLSSAYAFSGEIDRVRVWKRDEDAMPRNFGQRPIDPAARDAWDRFWECLRRELNAEETARLRAMAESWDELLRELFRAIHRAAPQERESHLAHIAAYRTHWRTNALAGPEFRKAIAGLRGSIARLAGAAWLDRAEAIGDAIADLIGCRCLTRRTLRTADPGFAAAFIDRGAASWDDSEKTPTAN